MISPEVQKVADVLAKAEVNKFTIGIFAASFRLALRDMDMYCFEENFKRCHVKKSQ